MMTLSVNIFDKYLACHEKIRLFQLLNHTSGLPAHRPYYKKLVAFPLAERMDIIVDWILAEKLLFQPGTDNLYSDLGFILLGRIIEKVSGEPLDEFWHKKIIKPLDLDKGLYFASKRKKGIRGIRGYRDLWMVKKKPLWNSSRRQLQGLGRSGRSCRTFWHYKSGIGLV